MIFFPFVSPFPRRVVLGHNGKSGSFPRENGSELIDNDRAGWSSSLVVTRVSCRGKEFLWSVKSSN